MGLPGVYLIRNSVSDKVYVGSSSSIGERWSQHLLSGIESDEQQYHRRHGGAMYHDMTHFGIESFEFTILDTVHDPRHRLSTEQSYIEEYDAIESGYNSINAPSTTKRRPRRWTDAPIQYADRLQDPTCKANVSISMSHQQYMQGVFSIKADNTAAVLKTTNIRVHLIHILSEAQSETGCDFLKDWLVRPRAKRVHFHMIAMSADDSISDRTLHKIRHVHDETVAKYKKEGVKIIELD